ncbi:MAG: PEP-CTERM sorting domain-containing protein [Planctomycetes bacterium]|nr:PEP-CTERM sorting domain-containing protein [Planctomycetota bacterium]
MALKVGIGRHVSELLALALVLVLVQAAVAQDWVVRLPGILPDTDKLTNSTGHKAFLWHYYTEEDGIITSHEDPSVWRLSLPQDTDGDMEADPGEDWSDTVNGVAGYWDVSHDYSCWAASANNLAMTISGVNRYYDWMYREGVPTPTSDNGTTFWYEGGDFPSYALDYDGWTNYTIWPDEPASSWWVNNPEWDIWSALREGSPVSVSVEWDLTARHAFTVYGIDMINKKLWIVDSDSDANGSEPYWMDYRFADSDIAGGFFQINWGGWYDMGVLTMLPARYWEMVTGGDWGTGSWASSYDDCDIRVIQGMIQHTPCVVTVTDARQATRLVIRDDRYEEGLVTLDIRPTGALNLKTLMMRDGCTINVEGDLYAGWQQTIDGLVTVKPGGSWRSPMGTIIVGVQQLNALVDQTGGTSEAWTAILGYEPQASGTWWLTGNSLAKVNELVIGDAGRGEVGVGDTARILRNEDWTWAGQQWDPATSKITLGREEGSYGQLLMNGGRIETNRMIVGERGTGLVDQQGGHITVFDELILGAEATGYGTYALKNDAYLRSGSTIITGPGGGTFTQSGTSTHDAGVLVIGAGAANARYDLTGGTLGAGELVLGRDQHSTGLLVQSGGILDITTGKIGLDGAGTLEINAGVMIAEDLQMGVGSTIATSASMTMSGESNGLALVARIGVNDDATVTLTDSAKLVALDLGLGVASGATGTLNLVSGELTADNEVLGLGGKGVLDHQSGSHIVSGTLSMGSDLLASVGQYHLHNGTLTTGSVIVGDRGSGTFQHDLGTHTVDGTLTVALQDNSLGTYTYDGGMLTTTHAVIGPAGTGKMYVNNGMTHQVLRSLTIGGPDTGSGLYQLDGGAYLKAIDADVVIEDNGILHVINGDIQANTLEMRGGGKLNASPTSGCVLTVNGLSSDANWMSRPSLYLQSLRVGFPSAYEHDATEIPVGAKLFIDQDLVCGWNDLGRIVQLDSSFVSAPQVIIGNVTGRPGYYHLTGATARLQADNVVLGFLGEGMMEQGTGTIATISETLTLGFAAEGLWLMNGGTLTNHEISMGWGDWGMIEQNGGTHQVDLSVTLGAMNAAGTYRLTGGDLTAAAFHVGHSSYGELAILGGTADIDTMTVADELETGGQVTLAGTAALNTQTVRVGVAGAARFTQTGGTHAVSGELTVGESFPYEANNAYELSDGALTTARTTIGRGGSGKFTQTGGTHTVSDTLTIGAVGHKREGAGYYTLRGGTLDAAAIAIEGHEELAVLAYYGGQLLTSQVTVTGARAALALEADWTVTGARITLQDSGLLHSNRYIMTLRDGDLAMADGYLYGDTFCLQSSGATSSTLRGYGTIDNMDFFDNGGRVIADGAGRVRMLDMIGVSHTASSYDEYPGPDWGWYAVNKGVLRLPSCSVPTMPYNLAWSGAITWGGDSDLVNAVYGLFSYARPSTSDRAIDLSILAPDSTIPEGLPGQVLGLWEFDPPANMTMSSASLRFRYDASSLDAADWTLDDFETYIHTFQYVGGQWVDVTSWSDDWYAKTGDLSSLSLFAVSAVPEPATAALLLAGLAALTRRRRGA